MFSYCLSFLGSFTSLLSLVLLCLSHGIQGLEDHMMQKPECQMWAKLENKTLPLQDQGHANCTTNSDCTGFTCKGIYQVSTVHLLSSTKTIFLARWFDYNCSSLIYYTLRLESFKVALWFEDSHFNHFDWEEVLETMNLFMFYYMIFLYIILGWYHKICWWKLRKKLLISPKQFFFPQLKK